MQQHNTQTVNLRASTAELLNSQTRQQELAQVTKVVDGDTIEVILSGKKEKIRLIGVNTPETVDPRKPVECFGKEASAKTHELLDNATVVLESDQSQGNRDRYDRLLRYVTRDDGLFVNKILIQSGFAHEYTYDKPYRYQSEFRQAQKQAEQQHAGLWADSACTGAATPI